MASVVLAFWLSTQLFSFPTTMMIANDSTTIVHSTDDSFENDVLKASKPVLVDFWAPWCGPCKAIAPILEDLAQERNDIRIVKVNIDDNSKRAAQYQVRAIPTLMLFKEGEMIKSIVGAVRKPELEELING